MSPKGLLQLSLVIPVAVRKHAFLNTILCSLRVVRIEIMVLLKGFNLIGTKLSLKSLQCARLPKCPLKVFNAL